MELAWSEGGAGHAPEGGADDGPGTDENLVIEVKGLEREQDRAKRAGMQRWIDVVNHRGRLGRWRFENLPSPHDLGRVL